MLRTLRPHPPPSFATPCPQRMALSNDFRGLACNWVGHTHRHKLTDKFLQDAHTHQVVCTGLLDTANCPLCFFELKMRIYCTALQKKKRNILQLLYFFSYSVCVHISLSNTNACNYSTHCISMPPLSLLNIFSGLQSF